MSKQKAIEGAKPLTPEERMQNELLEREQANTALTWMQVMNAAARPFMTLMFALAFTVVCSWAWFRGDLSAEAYMNGISPFVATLVGFWFGERAAKATSDNPEGEGR